MNNERKDKLSSKQRERQSVHYRDNGRYSKTNPCYRCGKSAGVDYFSVLADTSDSLGNHWSDTALCLCLKCAMYLEELTEKDPAAAWSEVTSKEYGTLPQGKKK